MVKPMDTTLFVIDATFLLEATRKTFHGAPLLKDANGHDTTMLFGFARDLFRLRNRLGARNGLVVVGNDRTDLPETVLADVIDFLQRLRVPVVQSNVARAGDLCAGLNSRCNWIVTSNKAMLQLISDQCGVIFPMRGGEIDIVTNKSIQQRFGVRPHQVPSFLMLTDKSGHDPALTHRQAVRFLELYGSLDAGLEEAQASDLDQVRRKLLARKDVLLERCHALRFSAAPGEGMIRSIPSETRFIDNEEEAASVLKMYGFWSLIRLLPLSDITVNISEILGGETSADYRAVRTRADFDELEKLVKAAQVCAIDTEASDKDPRNASLYGVAFSVRERQGIYVPLTQADLDGVSSDEVRAWLIKLFMGETNFIGHNIKYDYVILWKHGIKVHAVHFDTMLAAGECFGDWEFFNLGEVSRKLLGKTIKRYGDIVEKGQTFMDVPFKELVDHACTDADIALRLYRRLSEELRKRGIEEVFLKERMGLLTSLAERECEGVKIDVTRISGYAARFEIQADDLKKAIFEKMSFEFDLNSPKATGDALRKMDSLKEKIGSRGPTQSEMEKLAWHDPLIERIVRYGRIRKKLRDIDAIISAAKKETVFPLFSQIRSPHVSFTSASPNMDEALRVGAVIDELLRNEWADAKRSLQRLQQATGDSVLKDELVKGQRSGFKSGDSDVDGLEQLDIVLSTAIGLSDATMCRRFLISPGKAANIRINMRGRYAVAFEWLDCFCRKAIAQGYAEYSGQRIYMEGLRSANIDKKNKATRAAVRWLLHYA